MEIKVGVKCCKGLFMKEAQFSLGYFCMKLECEIECKFIGTSEEGIYDNCDDSLIKLGQCYWPVP